MRNFAQNLEVLSTACGACGDEAAVRKLIYDEVIAYPDCIAKTDNAGNLIVTKKGKKPSKNKVMFSSSMDEVGFIITNIDEKGFLKFSNIGEIDSRVIVDKRVLVGKNFLPGLLGSKAIHLVKKEEFDSPTKTKDLYIDIGAESREEAEKLVNLGDRAVFDSDFSLFGDGCAMGKALDARTGCAVLMELLKEESEFDFTACFTVKGELGGIGGANAAFSVKPDIAVVLGSASCGDMPTAGGKTLCKQGEGAVISFRDGRTLYDMELFAKVNEIAKEAGIKAQTKQGVFGDSEAYGIHKAVGGVRTVSIAVPVRYAHSPYSVLKLSDCEQVIMLAKKISENFGEI